MNALGIVNDDWGVCGFTSTFYAMYDANPAARGMLINATKAYSVLFEIKDYLESRKQQNSPLLDDITNFTQSFGPPYDTFDVDTYIANVEAASASSRTRRDILDDPTFAIAMPPQAVVDYIQGFWKWQATITEFGAANSSGDAIIGVARQIDNTKPYHNLRHYLYRGSGAWYSWGKRFNSLAEAGAHVGADYKICYAITIRKY